MKNGIHFISGMPRSGSTLLSALLRQNPRIHAAMTSPVGGLVNSMLRAMSQENETAIFIEDEQRERILRGIVDGFYADLHPSKLIFDTNRGWTSKLALLTRLFPEAKVIFAQRDPRDVCLSAHLQLMTPSPATAHLLTWEGTARLYAATLAWWAHIRPRLSLQVLDLRYEAVIADFEAACRPMFGFLGLAWTDAARDFHTGAAGRFIASPSRNQVSRPLYATSVGRWRRHASQFAAVDGMLAPAVEALGYLR